MWRPTGSLPTLYVAGVTTHAMESGPTNFTNNIPKQSYQGLGIRAVKCDSDGCSHEKQVSYGADERR